MGGLDVGWVVDNLDRIGELLVTHVYLTVLTVAIGLAISFGLALVIRSRPRTHGPIIGAAGVIYSIPSLALLGLLIPVTGLGVLTAEIALVSYTLLILTRNIVEALRGVPADAVDAALGMGFTTRQRLMRVELPLALPVIVAGVRIATVTTIGLLTVAVLIGVDNLGYLIVTIGINRGSFGLTPTFTGIVLSVALAVAADLGLLAVQRALTPWARARGA